MSTPRFLSLQQLADGLEMAVDDYGLKEVISTLGVICSIKSGHILESYDDQALADKWEEMGKTLRELDTKGFE